MDEEHENAESEESSASKETVEEDLRITVEQVLKGERTLWRATEHLVQLAAPYVDEICLGAPLTAAGFNVDIVSRAIMRRTHDALAAIVATVNSPARASARAHLRTMVEDLIFLQWLLGLDEEVATQYVQRSSRVEISRAIQAQSEFLPDAYKKLGEDAPDLGFPDVTEAMDRARDELKEFCQAQGWGNRPPSVRRMAEVSELESVYDFFYFLSSKAVHSNLHEMGRMVWGTERTVDISSRPFEGVHADLAVVYGVWLFDSLLDVVMDRFEPVQRLSSGQAYSVWLALILVGPARNRRLPLLIHPEELRWRQGSTKSHPS